MTGSLDGWTVVFDLDGTLVDTAPDLLLALNDVLDHAGLETVDLQTVAGMIGHGAKAMNQKGMSHQGLTPSDAELEGLFARFLVYYSEHIAIGSRPFDKAPRFAAIIGADSVPSKKPDGDHIVRTVHAAGGDPARAIMVGDSRTDERAARNAGLPFVFVPFGYEAESVEAIGADAVVSHYSQLPEALSRLISQAVASARGR